MGPAVSLIFLDMMTRHHQGAIDMAREELACSQDARVKELASVIIDAQQREIDQMATWRTAWAASGE